MAALVVVVFLVYQPAWHGGPVWDDDAHITRPELRSWHGLYRTWFEVGATLQYYPLLHTAFWVEHKLWGDDTLGYHLVNLALHALAAVLVALILRRLAVPGAYLAAAIFALHPVHVESVAWITELKNTLSAVFYLGAMLSYLHFDQTRSRPRYATALLLYLLALLSKTVTGMFPAAMLVILWWKRGRLSGKRDVLPLVPFFLLGAAGGLVTAWWEWALNRCQGGEFDLSFLERCLIAGRAVWFYPGKLFWPTELIFSYPRWHVQQGAWWQYLFPLGVLALLAALWLVRRQTRAPLAAVLFFVVTLFPVLSFFNLYTFRFSYVADHYQYLASLGIIALVSAAVAGLLSRWGLWRRPAGYAVCLALLGTLAGLTWRQAGMYTDIERLYRTTLARNPDSWMAHNNLGFLLAARGQGDEALAHFRKSLEINPEDVAVHANLGKAFLAYGRVDEALVHYRKAVALDPESANCQNNLGNTLARRGQVDEAIVHLRKALEIDPDHATAHMNLGNVLVDQGQIDEAIAHYQKAVENYPRYADAHYNLGKALVSQGRIDEAIAHFGKALEINPDDTEARHNLHAAQARRKNILDSLVERRGRLRSHPTDVALLNDLAWRLATSPAASARDGKEAVELARRAVRLSGGGRPEILDTLAAACAEAGRFAEAVETAQRAVELASAQNNTVLANVLRVRLKLYQAGSPFRDTR